MSNELESASDTATSMVVIEQWWRFRVTGADGAQVVSGYYCETVTEADSESDESPSSTNPQ